MDVMLMPVRHRYKGHLYEHKSMSEYAYRDETVPTGWRHAVTGRIITQRKALFIRKLGKYWNFVRRAKAAHWDMSVGEIRSGMREWYEELRITPEEEEPAFWEDFKEYWLY